MQLLWPARLFSSNLFFNYRSDWLSCSPFSELCQDDHIRYKWINRKLLLEIWSQNKLYVFLETASRHITGVTQEFLIIVHSSRFSHCFSSYRLFFLLPLSLFFPSYSCQTVFVSLLCFTLFLSGRCSFLGWTPHSWALFFPALRVKCFFITP